ncbi:MAG: hypothetical protein ABS948_15380 [Solibacillus sp.]
MVIIINVPLINKHGLAGSALYIGVGVFIVALVTVNYYAKIPDGVKAFLFAAVPGGVILALFVLDGYGLNKHYLLLLTVIMAAIYFDKKILISYASVVCVGLITLYLVMPGRLVGENTVVTMYVTIILVFIGIIYLLNRLTDWGRELIVGAEQKVVEANKLLAETQKLVATIEATAQTIGNEAAGVQETSVVLGEVSEKILTSTEQIAESVQHEADSIHAIQQVMSHSQSRLTETVALSKDALTQSDRVNTDITENAQSVQQVTTHMNILNDSMNTAVRTMSELQTSL